MPTYVRPVATGRWEGDLRFVGERALRGQVVTLPRALDRRAWVASRWLGLVFVLRDEHGLSELEANNAATVALVLCANESGWGVAEWRWNAGGLHCSRADRECMRFDNDSEVLAAFDDLQVFARRFLSLLRENSGDEGWRLLRAGDLWALRRVGHVWSLPSERARASIMRRVVAELEAANPSLRGQLPLVHEAPEDGGRGGARGGARRLGVVLGLALGVAAVWSLPSERV